MATKKSTSTIITPIDERETFVSLSLNKGLGESDSMEQKLRTLYKIQQTDTKIDRIHLLRGELPLEVQDLEDEIEGLKTRMANIREDMAAAEQEITSHKLKIEECKKDAARYEAQRDNVRNNREYDSLSKEIEFQELEQQASNKKISEATLFLYDRKVALEETEKKLAIRSEDLVGKKKELEIIIEETAKEEEILTKEREALSQNIDERMMVAYSKVRSNAKNHLAVVTVKRDACGGCFNKIPPQRKLDIASSKKIIVCEYCGRILVSSEFEEGEASEE